MTGAVVPSETFSRVHRHSIPYLLSVHDFPKVKKKKMCLGVCDEQDYACYENLRQSWPGSQVTPPDNHCSIWMSPVYHAKHQKLLGEVPRETMRKFDISFWEFDLDSELWSFMWATFSPNKSSFIGIFPQLSIWHMFNVKHWIDYQEKKKKNKDYSKS